MSKAQSGDTVKVDYVGKLDDGTVFDSSQGGEPLEFTVGGGQMIPGFDRAVVGMAVGETRTANITADDAYGQRRDDLAFDVPQAQFPDDVRPEVGQRLQVAQPEQPPFAVTVTAVGDEVVTLDANHPLAGKDLTFDITLVEIA